LVLGSLISPNGFAVGGAVTGIEATQAFGSQNVLHRRRSQAGLMGDVIGTQPALVAQPDHFTTSPRGRFVR
jgi:hypothetical protein